MKSAGHNAFSDTSPRVARCQRPRYTAVFPALLFTSRYSISKVRGHFSEGDALKSQMCRNACRQPFHVCSLLPLSFSLFVALPGSAAPSLYVEPNPKHSSYSAAFFNRNLQPAKTRRKGSVCSVNGRGVLCTAHVGAGAGHKQNPFQQARRKTDEADRVTNTPILVVRCMGKCDGQHNVLRFQGGGVGSFALVAVGVDESLSTGA